MNADPQRVEELIKRLTSFTNETVDKQKQIKGYINNLSNSWNDGHYNVLLQQYQDFEKKMMNALLEAQTLMIPNLKNVKKVAEDYKNLGRKS